ncbi:MAG: P1 family peptidase [Acidimicrobiaceae bacterium]|nr:P1 family peptidase [Acidimicrobiaceae bacterium]
MITAIEGIRVGHWTDRAARTGCTAVLLPEAAVVSGEIRGGAPGTREWALLDPARRVEHVDVVMLTGGSAFGLAACDGAMRWCAAKGLGVPTSAGAVPIVVGLVIFDLAVGSSTVRPGPDEGYAACESATTDPIPSGPVGAGAGATVAKVRGEDGARPGGLGSAMTRDGSLEVAALVVANAYGDIRPGTGFGPEGTPRPGPVAPPLGATTVGMIVTNARLTKLECHLAAQSGHDGLARAVQPAHTGYDGDGLVAAATGAVDADIELVRAMAAEAVELALRDAAEPQ